MTPEKIERDRAPERIWIDAERTYSATSFSAGIKYIRADLHDAEVQRLTAERDAALAGAVRVKPLVWRETDPGRCGASTALGDYRIDDNGPAWIFDRFYLLLIGGGAISVHPSKAEAQAAAQADYEARIAARIESAPVTVQEAARVLRDWADTAEWLHNTDYEAFTRQLRRALAGETP